MAIPTFRLLLTVCIGSQSVCLVKAADPDTDPLGRAWSKTVEHYDGTYTKSVKHADKSTIDEKTFNSEDKLVVTRQFYLDTAGNLRYGMIYDGKGNFLASTLYGYKGNTMTEERMYDNRKRLMRQLFPPGVLPNVPQNQKRSIALTYDPETGKQISQTATDERPVEPISEADQSFQPGTNSARPLINDRTKLPVLEKAPEAAKPASGRVPMLKPKKTP